MMKILILCPDLSLPGGVSNFINLLGLELEKEKYEVRYFFVAKKRSLFKNIFYPLFLLIDGMRLKMILKSFKPDVIHINPSLAFLAIFRDFFLLNIVKKEGHPVVLFIHGWQKQMSKKFQYNFFKSYFMKRFEKADAVIVLAMQFKEELSTLGVTAKKIHVFTTMVTSPDYFQPEKNFSKPFTVLYCGAMKKSKGPYELLNAIPFVMKKYGDTSFIFLGDGEELERLKAKANKLGITKNVTFAGYKTGDEKIGFFKQAHIFVFPSHSEGFPTVVLEAMAAGLPLVVTPVGGLAQTIVENKQGLIIQEKELGPLEIAQKILYLMDNPAVMRRMSQDNIREAREKFDSKIVTAKLIEIYKKIYEC